MKNEPYTKTPDGKLILRTLAMPSDTNANGDIFGGWIMSQMDLGGAILAKELAKGRVVTVTVDKMIFHLPISVGDVVCCYGTLVTEALFTYVAIDKEGKPRPIPRENNPELDEALALLETSQAEEKTE